MYGIALAKTFAHHGSHVILGPGVQLHHHPRNGRNFEYLGCEDPVVGAWHADAVVRGITSQAQLSTLKHYDNNDWERGRNTGASNAVVPMEASMELYVKPFVAGLAGGSQAVMCGYNEADGITMCGHTKRLGWLNDLTRRMFYQMQTTTTASTARYLLVIRFFPGLK
ncbi:unnamed protein product [Amoebophrya sp. A120]|nr:unnamed protein product [Amoebophrya sp. A120]|eukprot:GSA120T00004562001.1